MQNPFKPFAQHLGCKGILKPTVEKKGMNLIPSLNNPIIEIIDPNQLYAQKISQLKKTLFANMNIIESQIFHWKIRMGQLLKEEI